MDVNVAWTSPIVGAGEIAWAGLGGEGREGNVKCKCSVFICLENPHRLCFPLELYVMVAIHMMGGDTCVPGDIAPSVTTHKTGSFSLSHGASQ